MAINRVAILVAGHGGGDPGATGQGTIEANETINIVDKVYDLLAPHPDIIVEKAPNSQDYVASTAWVNANYLHLDDGVVVEVHKNSFSGSATGIETFTGIGPDGETTRLATCVNNGQVETTGLRNRGIKQGAFYLITDTNPRAVLTESGFVSDGGDPVGDAANKKYALGIANGICDFFGVARPNATPPKPVFTTKDISSTAVTPFTRIQRQDASMPAGETKITTVGVNGSVTTTWTVTYTNGVETSRKEKSKVVKDPVTEVLSIGIKQSTIDPADYEATKARVSTLEALVKTIVDFLSGIFSRFKK